MMQKYIACSILAIVFFIIILFYSTNTEKFATKRDKAEAIYDYMGGRDETLYNDYKKALNGKSNIVEYEDMLSLKRTNNFTVSNIEKSI